MRKTMILLALALGLAACNTVKGVGQDVKKAGDTVEDTAKEHGATKN